MKFSFLVLCSVLLYSCSLSNEDGEGSIAPGPVSLRGTVVDAENHPIEGMVVEYKAIGQKDTTDEKGRWSLQGNRNYQVLPDQRDTIYYEYNNHVVSSSNFFGSELYFEKQLEKREIFIEIWDDSSELKIDSVALSLINDENNFSYSMTMIRNTKLKGFVGETYFDANTLPNNRTIVYVYDSLKRVIAQSPEGPLTSFWQDYIRINNLEMQNTFPKGHIDYVSVDEVSEGVKYTLAAVVANEFEGRIKKYEWDFGDGEYKEGDSLASFIHTADSTIKVFLRVSDDESRESLFEYDVFKRGSFIDLRDSTKYGYTRIGSQIWMSENLKYLPWVNEIDEYELDSSKDTSFYYVYGYTQKFMSDLEKSRSLPYNLAESGVLYPRKVMLGDSVDNQGKYLRGICPEGWHIPEKYDWDILWEFLEKEFFRYDKPLILKDITKWTRVYGESFGQKDSLISRQINFKAEFSGKWTLLNGLSKRWNEPADTASYWWTAGPVNRQNVIRLGYNKSTIQADPLDAYAIRCLKDEDQ